MIINEDVIKILERPITVGMETGGNGTAFVIGSEGVGKTTLTLELCWNYIIRGYRVMYVCDHMYASEKQGNLFQDDDNGNSEFRVRIQEAAMKFDGSLNVNDIMQTVRDKCFLLTRENYTSAESFNK